MATLELSQHQQFKFDRLKTDLERLEAVSFQNYIYPNAVDFHEFKPTPEATHLCYYCDHANEYFLHEEPYVALFVEAVQAKREANPKTNLTETHLRYIELDKRKDEIKKFYEELKEVTEQLIAENGVNHFFQDSDGTVYKTVVPEGTFVQFKKYDVKRTRRGEEKKGELSLTEAREAGFTVEGK